MPSVTLAPSEYRRDLLPPVCAKCGAPALEKVPRRFRIPPDQFVWLWALPVIVTLISCPPLFMLLSILIAEKVEVRVPMCGDHRCDWVWRDRVIQWVVFPVWSLAAIGLGVFFVLDPEMFCLYWAACLLLVVLSFVMEFFVVGYGSVLLLGGERMEVTMRRVHPEFKQALSELLERDRVENPLRYQGFGDQRDDYDDEPTSRRQQPPARRIDE